MHRGFLLALLATLASLSGVMEAASQVKAPTLRDQVRKKGAAWTITIGDDFFLATFDQLIARSDLIIRGRVVDEKTRLSRDEYCVRTDYTIEVLEVLLDRQHAEKVGGRLVVTKGGGNFLVEGKPVRDDVPQFPPIPWIAPHIFFITRWTGPNADGQYYFAGAELGVFRIEEGKIVCDTRERSTHPVTREFCNKNEEEFLQIIKERIATSAKLRSAP